MQATTPPPSKDQWAILAGTRFALAICVLISHTGVFIHGFFSYALGQTGYPAVFGFLMISGYSIASSITRSRKGYFLRRVKRIYPSYVMALLLAFLVYKLFTVKNIQGDIVGFDGWGPFIGNFLMLQRTATHFIWIDGAVWSLSVEWWCYMLAILLIRFKNSVSVAVLWLSFMAYMVYSLLFGYKTGDSLPYGTNFAFLAWSWLSGFVYQRSQTNTNFLVMMFLPIIVFDTYGHQQYASIIIALSAMSILFSKTITIRSESVSRLLTWLGDMSYPLYLFHYPILFALYSTGFPKHELPVIFGIVASVSVAYAIGRLLIRVCATGLASFHGNASRDIHLTRN